jgi:hypothetical protein
MSVDIDFEHQRFRLIGTHLESQDAGLRRLQGAELRDIAAQSALPVVIAMDSNAQAAPTPLDSTYVDFIGAGYLDSWAIVHPGLLGATCCQTQEVNNAMSLLSSRIDLVMLLGQIAPSNAALFGADPSSRLPDGLWPSDHAGVAVQLSLP